MQRIENITNSIHISWIPSFNCNFSCRYCAPEFYQKTAPIASLKQLKIIYYKLQPFIDNKKNIVFILNNKQMNDRKFVYCQRIQKHSFKFPLSAIFFFISEILSKIYYISVLCII